jgi:glutamyl-tRNA synthetase
MTTMRTRFAPSPTGVLHLGNARTALFNWLLARRHGGVFVLRIEDTDRERSTPENIQIILDALQWLGLDFDEGPFFQSERMAQYHAAADRLIAEGHAYRCRCTPVELEAKRQQAIAEKRKSLYDRTCREKNYGPEQPHVVRLKMPPDGSTVLDDLIKGRVEVNNAEMDDWIILRSDGSPVYNFCVVIDDTDMRITHVVRGEDHLTNTHKQLHVYRALGLEPPRFGHLPLILGKDRAKMSKRDGATDLLDYQELGYLPQAMRNFLARLGWSHGDQELFTDDELIKAFTLETVSASNAIFDQDKLNWTNASKIREAEPRDLVEPLLPFLRERGYAAEDGERLLEIIAILRDRSTTLVDMADRARMFYCAPEKYDEKAVKKHWKGEARAVLERFVAWLKTQDPLRQEDIMPFIEGLAQQMSLQLGQIAQPIRIALTGSSASPPIEATIALIGRDEVIARVEKALRELPLPQDPADVTTPK